MNLPRQDIPQHIETERLLLRCPVPGDGAVVNEALRESWPQLSRWMHWATGEPPSVEETETLQKRNQADFLALSDFSFNMFLKSGGEFVGKVSVCRLDWHVPKGEIGYWLRTLYSGQGLMTEAVTALTAFALYTLGLVRVEIRCDQDNLRSAAIPLRSDYTLEGCLRKDCRNPQGALRDTLVYATVRTTE